MKIISHNKRQSLETVMEQTVLDKPEWNRTDPELKHNKDPHRDKRITGNTQLYRTKWKHWVGNMY